jgi:hypothetical protein
VGTPVGTSLRRAGSTSTPQAGVAKPMLRGLCDADALHRIPRERLLHRGLGGWSTFLRVEPAGEPARYPEWNLGELTALNLAPAEEAADGSPVQYAGRSAVDFGVDEPAAGGPGRPRQAVARTAQEPPWDRIAVRHFAPTERTLVVGTSAHYHGKAPPLCARFVHSENGTCAFWIPVV